MTPAGEGPTEEQTGAGLPVDLRAIAIALWLRRRWLVVSALIAIAVGLCLGSLLAKRTYTAETVMLYQPPPVDTLEGGKMPSLMTLLSMVKLSSNLETVRERLKLDTDVKTLGAATSVQLQQKTTLVTIQAKWETARGAATIANALREAFLENQGRLRREEFETDVKDLEQRLEPVMALLNEKSEKLRAYTSQNRIVDLSQEARATLDEYGAVNLLYEQAVIEKKSNDLQVENTQRIVNELQEAAAKEQKAEAALNDQMSETNIRIQRLRESIMDDKEHRADFAMLEEARATLERARASFDAGAISQAELDEAVAKFKVIEAKSVDTPEIAGWKKEIDDLDAKVIPSRGNTGPTGNLLKDIMYRSFEIKLAQTTTDEKVTSLAAAKARVEERLKRMPDLQRGYAEMVRDVESVAAERKVLEEKLAEARRLLESSSLPFTLVAAAEPPAHSSSSTAKKIAAAVTVLLGGAAFFLIAVIAVLDPRVRTGREATIRLEGLPVLAELPLVHRHPELVHADGTDGPLVEAMRGAARRLRVALPRRGARILLVSAGYDEGVTTVAAHLALVFGRWDEKVLLIDAAVRREDYTGRPPAVRHGFRDIPALAVRALSSRGLEAKPPAPPENMLGGDLTKSVGFGRLLADREIPLAAAVVPSSVRGVSLLPRSPEAVSPDLLASERIRTLLAQASEEYALVLIESPPALTSVDAENLSLLADAVVFVAKAHGPFSPAMREAVAVYERGGIPILGIVVNKVRAEFCHRAARGHG